ncbi:MAG: sugar phosphate nucleotidyltransferase [Candidatus Eisenbacteria bacterium]|nr:sugar phosphate nucleotidyltransferase [Candidatus Eisenbacteria bacterium]
MTAIPEGSAAIILAAGKGTRMQSELPKVAVLLGGRPLIRYVLDATFGAGLDRVVAVVGYRRDIVAEAIGSLPVLLAVQEEQRGTGHAVMMAAPFLEDQSGPVVVLAGDIPLIRAATIAELLRHHAGTGAAVTVLTADLSDPSGYGRIVRGPDGRVLAIVEEKDATAEVRLIREINSSIYAFDWSFLSNALGRLTSRNAQGEYYLTDTLRMAALDGRIVEAIKVTEPSEVSGVNTVEQLAELEAARDRMDGRGGEAGR